ncbi:MAG TPA: alpha-amylase family glycosyl hydrolase [Anaeromyxobacteraceae bacterium]|nr:alpha-amylase family glycosyl hydrolase [Anaeromyxobacteraceae bacterium]
MKPSPLLYQLNTRVLLGEWGRALGRAATLDDLPDSLLDELAGHGFDWVWPLGVWRTGPAARAVSLARADWRQGFQRDLPDLRDEDVTGSPFAIQAYEVKPEFGGEAALSRLRTRMSRRGLSLLLDFVPNHVSPDHPWVTAHPEWLIEGTEEDLEREPANWVRLGGRILAHGRDPYFPGWADTVQLDYRHPGLREAMVGELRRVAARCDGVRCDMAMLVLPDVFARTWGQRSHPRGGTAHSAEPFWPGAISAVRRERPGFAFMAEVYWDLEWELLQQGFDFAYDKRLYDRLRAGEAGPVRGHLCAAPDFQLRSARFLENHDEPRAAATFPPERHPAAAVLSFLVPGLRFFHEGQLEGRKVHVSMHLGRRPAELVDERLRAFYRRLLAVLARPEVHDGRWRLRECRPAWEGNPTWQRFIVMSWEGPSGRLLACVNFGPTQGQCYAEAGFPGLESGRVLLTDLVGSAIFVRAGDALAGGLYLDMPAWGYHVFEVRHA